MGDAGSLTIARGGWRCARSRVASGKPVQSLVFLAGLLRSRGALVWRFPGWRVARFRGIERPIYGYFVDHTVDALGNLIIMIGFGLTLYIRMDVSLFALLGYFLLCMYVFINNHLSGVFQLSFVGMGPTELRLCLVALNTWMFFGGPENFKFAGQGVFLLRRLPCSWARRS